MQLFDENTHAERCRDLVEENRAKNSLDHLHTSRRDAGADRQTVEQRVETQTGNRSP